MKTIWQELNKTALLGTERRPLPPETLDQLQKLGIVTTHAAPTVLLDSAALVGQMRKAGKVLPNFIGNLPEPTLVSEENFCNRISIRHLELILNGPYKKALPEFIFLAAKANQILPPEYLPAFFQESMRNKKLWETILPIIGNHGHWLLRQNPNWNRLVKRMEEPKTEAFSEAEIYPILKNKFQIWGEDDVAFRSRPEDFAELRAFWQSVETSIYDNFIQKSLQILLFREEMIKELVIG